MDQTPVRKKRRLSLTVRLFIVALLLGMAVSLVLAANTTASRYRVTLKSELTSFRQETNTVDKIYATQEVAAFTSMRAILKDYSQNVPIIKPIVLGTLTSSSYRSAKDSGQQYQKMIKEYDALVNEYFDKAAKTKAVPRPSPQQKSYLSDYAKRLEAVKQQRRQLETALEH